MIVRAAVALHLLAAPLWAASPARFTVAVQDVPGIPAGIADVAQDSEGFLWIAAEEGLFRFDGTEFVRWGERMRLQQVTSGPEGAIVAHELRGPLFERAGEELRPVRDGQGAAVESVEDAGFDREGALWIVRPGDILRRSVRGGWSVISVRHGLSIAPLARGGVVVGTRDGRIAALDGDGGSRELASRLGGLVKQVAEDESGRIVATLRGGPRGGIVRVGRGGIDQLLASPARPTGLALRRGTVWTSWDDGIVAVRGGGAIERFGAPQGFEGGGSLFVDREMSLWASSFEGGLTRVPEPDTAIWTGASGLPHTGFRQVVAGGDARYAFSWLGALRWDEPSGSWLPCDASPYGLIDLGVAGAGGDVWTSGLRFDPGDGRVRGTLFRMDGGAVVPALPEGEEAPWVKGAQGPDGALRLAYGRDLLLVPRGGARPRRVATLPEELGPVFGIAIAPDGATWVAGRDGPLCSLAPGSSAWHCAQPDSLEAVMTMRFSEPGRLWVGSERRGLLDCGDGSACTSLLGRDVLGSDAAVWLEASPRGGMWVVGRLTAVRVVPERAGARVVETITRAHGLPRWWLASVQESDDGTLWVAALGGIARIPAEARERDGSSPPVRLTQVAIAGVPVAAGAAARAVAGREPVSVHWAALSFADPSRLRFRFRLHDGEPWLETDRPRLTMLAPKVGDYHIETEASLDGASWSASPAAVSVHVVPPWFARGWFWGAVASAAALAALVAHRLRVAHLLRLERQRAEIAMDLHDDLGATLGGIGLLASMAADSDEPARARALERIAHQSGSASGTLSEIVWSLRPGTETLDQLVHALRDRVADLAPDRSIEVRVDAAPAETRVSLGFTVRRNVLWIAVEALRNAIRHGRAATVQVRLSRRADGWLLTVEDDGIGLASGAAPGPMSGLGMESMRRRAEAIGGRLAVESAGATGTRVALAFRADGRPPRMIV